MARRKSRTKIQPVPLKLNFLIPAGTNTNFIDISQCVSLLSRKFLRQGLNWAIAGGRILMPNAASGQAGNAVYVSTLQHSWCVSNSWHKTQLTWLKQQNDALEESGMESVAGKFRDFKIFADQSHVNNTEANNLLPINLGPGTTVGPFPTAIVTTGSPLPGEWLYSEIVIPNDAGVSGNTVEYKLHMHGADSSGSKGMVEGYSESRAYPQSPDPAAPSAPEDSFLSQMFDVGETMDEIVQNATNRNDELPYNQELYPGGGLNYNQLENQVFVFNTNTIGISEYKFTGFSAPCGLIRIDQLYSDTNSETNSSDLIIEIELMPGTHRGYLAEPMQDM